MMKNEEITIYELMELFVNHNPPQKIKYCNSIFTLKEEQDDYENERTGTFLYDLFGSSISTLDFLNKIVEILPEENNEWIDIEEFTYKVKPTDDPMEEHLRLLRTFNLLIKNQKYLKEKLESKDER